MKILSSNYINLNKKNLMMSVSFFNVTKILIDQQISRHFVHYSVCLYHLLPFYATQIINPLLTSMISANNNKVLGFQPIVEILHSLMFLQCIISFVLLLVNSSTLFISKTKQCQCSGESVLWSPCLTVSVQWSPCLTWELCLISESSTD